MSASGKIVTLREVFFKRQRKPLGMCGLQSEEKEKKDLHWFGGSGLLEEVEGAVARDENPKRKTTS